MRRAGLNSMTNKRNVIQNAQRPNEGALNVNRYALTGTETGTQVLSSLFTVQSSQTALNGSVMPSGGIERGVRTLRRTPAGPNWCCASGRKPRRIYHTQLPNVPMHGTG